MHYTLLLGTNIQPWQCHTISYGHDTSLDIHHTTTSHVAPPKWQALLENTLFKYRAPQIPHTPLAKEGTIAPQNGVIDITGVAAALPHRNILIKPFFNDSFDTNTLRNTIIADIPPTIGWAVRHTLDSPWYILIQAEIALREPLALQATLGLCGERLQQLLVRGIKKLEAGYPPTVPFVPIKQPQTFSYTKLALKQLQRKIPLLLQKPFFRKNHWEMAIIPRTSPHSDRWTRLITPPTHFEADAFLWEENGKTYLFYEHVAYKIGKGRIAYRVVADDGTASEPVVALERPYHFSYPHLFRYNDTTYMLPENRNGRLEIYKSVAFPDNWELVHTFFDGVNAADSTLHFDGQHWWLFTNIATGTVPNWDELFLFYADSPFGDWTPHPQNPIKASAAGARMAGNFFVHNGALTRVGQDCRGDYGIQVLFFRVDVLTPEHYEETAIPCPIVLPQKQRMDGKKFRWHSYSQSSKFVAIDYNRVKRR